MNGSPPSLSAVCGNRSQPLRRTRSRRRTWLLRLLAVVFGLSVFLVGEAVFWLCGAGEPDMSDDPFVGFSDWQPLFIRDGDQYRIAPSRRRYFVDDSFPAERTADTFRIFCLGGSTVQGRPFGRETSFTTWLRLALEQADPQRRWEVVNCGGISYASYRLVPVLQEVLTYQPDLIIVCTGHNEFLEDRTYATLRDQSPLISVPHRWLSRTRSYHVYRGLIESVTGRTPPRATLGGEVEAFLDYHEGLRAYHRDDNWRAEVMEHFEFNLRRMAALTKRAGVPMLLVIPPSNLADTQPFKSEHRVGMTAEELARFNELMERSGQAESTLHRVADLEAARDIDSEYAALRFSLGRLYEAQDRLEEARDEYLAAREQDICPLRILAPMEAAILRVGADHDVPCLAAQQLLAEHSRHQLAGAGMLVDHVHPSFEGHQLIGLALADLMIGQHLLAPRNDRWKDAARAAFQQHFDALPQVYFNKGQQNLDALRYWASGQADGPSVESRYPEKLRD